MPSFALYEDIRSTPAATRETAFRIAAFALIHPAFNPGSHTRIFDARQ
jgi:hypothetical protein